jgi:EpsI family protein
MTKQTSGWPRLSMVIALLVATALFLHSRSQPEVLPPTQPLSEFPLQVGNWQGSVVSIPQWALDVLGDGKFMEHSYDRSHDEPRVDLFVAYFPTQKTGSTMHSPQNCLPGSGWTPVDSSRVDLPQPGGGKINVNRYILTRGLDRLLVYYWYQEHGRAVASEYWSKFYLVADSVKMNRSDGALIRITTPIRQDETVANAEQRGGSFIQEILPLLDRYIPR